jgi:hypothetical protein
MQSKLQRVSAFIICFSLAIGIAVLKKENKKFHSAETQAESALNKALLRMDYDEDMVGFILKFPWHNTKGDHRYADIFTPDVLKSWADAEAKTVKDQCHGEYKDGELCGLGYNPFTCAQDSPDYYLYHTIRSNEQEAIIMMKWPPAETAFVGITYRLIKDGYEWKIDGVDCGENQKFNMP